MEKLIKDFSECYASLQEAKGVAVDRVAELGKKIEENGKLKISLEGREKDLDVREEAVRLMEAPAKMLEEAKRNNAENKDLMKIITAAQKSIAKDRADYAAFISREKTELHAAQDQHKAEMDQLKEAWKQLKEDRKNYKDEVINKLKVSA